MKYRLLRSLPEAEIGQVVEKREGKEWILWTADCIYDGEVVVSGSGELTFRHKKYISNKELNCLATILQAVLNRGKFDWGERQGEILVNNLTPEELEAFEYMEHYDK